ncbi:Flavin reductase like domain-containing protein [Microlunatus sagamiharensis]|uniref:Flavin reductase like domain-containing protein n=1 Tax=Microlunatus sagamiharensis TaxID=546874 RepID=A0A1H2LWJ9_9ACTN|nr:flavin reductase [Microlunatus sagamiharensis]SDU85068.1 Flavin reductase like domain-containing protein [Microlunatus sagamiharensis]
MTIHSEHPFATPVGDRDPLRRLRGRTTSPVSLWTAGTGRDRAGWTVSSFLLADGDPGEVVGLLDEDSDLATLLTTGDGAAQPGATLVVTLLGWEQRALADAFAGLAPRPAGSSGWARGRTRTGAPCWTAPRAGPAYGSARAGSTTRGGGCSCGARSSTSSCPTRRTEGCSSTPTGATAPQN